MEFGLWYGYVQVLGRELGWSKWVLIMILDCICLGSLFFLLRLVWGFLQDNESIISFYIRQILQGFSYLYDNYIVYRDIKVSFVVGLLVEGWEKEGYRQRLVVQIKWVDFL